MTLPAPTYDLVLMLDTQAEAPVRAKIVADARSAIEAQGELLRHDEWGDRALAFPIDHKQAAEYHLLQFHSNTPELLRGLDRTLRITDGIVRFRIVKLKPGTPAAPDMQPGRRTESELGDPPHPAPPHSDTPEPSPEPTVEPELAVGEPA
ncbi:MAG TPA: 30S ribosomal protein S6 [Solirubrobacteraceae bacterium]|jgi:small subunit ribosomal protein S6